MVIAVQRRYIIPTSNDDVSLSEWLPDLTSYGIDVAYMSQEVLNSFLANDKEMPSAGLMNYVQEVLNHRYQEGFQSTHFNAQMQHHFEIEVDRMALICIDATQALYDHLKPHFLAIEDREASMGIATEKMDWEIDGVVGNDVILRVSIDEDKE